MTSVPMLLATLAVLATMAMVQSASFGGISSLSREMNFNSIPGGENEDSNLVEPAPFASLSDFLGSKQGFGKKNDDVSRMKALVKALYAMEALDKKTSDNSDVIDEEAVGAEDIAESYTATQKPETTTLAAATSQKPETTTLAATTTTTTTTAAPPTTEAEPTTDAPTLVHDSEVNEFVDQIAKHISTFFQGIMHYFDGPSLPANATVIIELEEKTENSSESNENSSESESKEDDEASTEDVPKWLVQMFESVAALQHDEASQEEDKRKDFRPKEPRQSPESQER